MTVGGRPSDRPELRSVSIGGWEVAEAPVRLRTLLGSCVGVVLLDREGHTGGLAHIVLPDSRGRVDSVGKYADTAVPALVEALMRLRGRTSRRKLTAKVLGGASMFREMPGSEIGRLNLEAVERILKELSIPVLARDAGGTKGRSVTLDLGSGVVQIRIPGGSSFEI